MSGLTTHRDLAKKIDHNRYLLILSARFDGLKKDRHSNLNPVRRDNPQNLNIQMIAAHPSPVQPVTIFLRRILVYLQYEFIQTANSVNLCLHVKVFHPIINHPLTSDLTHLWIVLIIAQCPWSTSMRHIGTTKHDLINEFLRF